MSAPPKGQPKKPKPHAAVKTIIGLQDAYLYPAIMPSVFKEKGIFKALGAHAFRAAMPLMYLSIHFTCSAIASARGHKSRTSFGLSFGHEITDKSLGMTARHIEGTMPQPF